jgi:hypothetical protein
MDDNTGERALGARRWTSTDGRVRVPPSASAPYVQSVQSPPDVHLYCCQATGFRTYHVFMENPLPDTALKNRRIYGMMQRSLVPIITFLRAALTL